MPQAKLNEIITPIIREEYIVRRMSVVRPTEEKGLKRSRVAVASAGVPSLASPLPPLDTAGAAPAAVGVGNMSTSTSRVDPVDPDDVVMSAIGPPSAASPTGPLVPDDVITEATAAAITVAPSEETTPAAAAGRAGGRKQRKRRRGGRRSAPRVQFVKKVCRPADTVMFPQFADGMAAERRKPAVSPFLAAVLMMCVLLHVSTKWRPK